MDAAFLTDLSRLGVALACGLALGLEREWKGKPAGLRTILLITFGSCAFVVAGDHLITDREWSESVVRADPTRIPSYVIAGIGFIGGGVILQHGNSVRGLTSAACVWMASAVGVLAGVDEYLLAALVTGGTIIALVVLDPVREHIGNGEDGSAYEPKSRGDAHQQASGKHSE